MASICQLYMGTLLPQAGQWPSDQTIQERSMVGPNISPHNCSSESSSHGCACWTTSCRSCDPKGEPDAFTRAVSRNGRG